MGRTKTEAGPTPASSQNSANGPKETPFEPGRHARDRAIAAVRESSRAGPKEWRTYKIESAYPAASSEGFGAIVYNWCGPVVGSRTWVVEMYFPNFEPSASLSQGQAFVSRFRVASVVQVPLTHANRPRSSRLASRCYSTANLSPRTSLAHPARAFHHFEAQGTLRYAGFRRCRMGSSTFALQTLLRARRSASGSTSCLTLARAIGQRAHFR